MIRDAADTQIAAISRGRPSPAERGTGTDYTTPLPLWYAALCVPSRCSQCFDPLFLIHLHCKVTSNWRLKITTLASCGASSTNSTILQDWRALSPQARSQTSSWDSQDQKPIAKGDFLAPTYFSLGHSTIATAPWKSGQTMMFKTVHCCGKVKSKHKWAQQVIHCFTWKSVPRPHLSKQWILVVSTFQFYQPDTFQVDLRYISTKFSRLLETVDNCQTRPLTSEISGFSCKLDSLHWFSQRRGPAPHVRTRTRFLYSAPSPKFHHPMLTRSEVIVLTNKQTHKQTPLKTSNALRYATTLGHQLLINITMHI